MNLQTTNHAEHSLAEKKCKGLACTWLANGSFTNVNQSEVWNVNTRCSVCAPATVFDSF